MHAFVYLYNNTFMETLSSTVLNQGYQNSLEGESLWCNG